MTRAAAAWSPVRNILARSTWPANVTRRDHVDPSQHRSFYNAQRATLNVTRADMIRAGYSPSVRLFEAAACGVPIVSDSWDGLSTFFRPGEEILLAQSAADTRAHLAALTPERRAVIGAAARARVLSEHTAAHRAETLERYVHEHGRLGRAAAAAAASSGTSPSSPPLTSPLTSLEDDNARTPQLGPRWGRIPRLSPVRPPPRRRPPRRLSRRPVDRLARQPPSSERRAPLHLRRAQRHRAVRARRQR